MNLPWSLGASAITGLTAGAAAVVSAKEERNRIRMQNAIYKRLGERFASMGRAEGMRHNQEAGGQLSYMQYRNKSNPQMLEALRGMYRDRLNAGLQAQSAGLAKSAEMLGKEEALPTQGKYDWMRAISGGLGAGATAFGNTYRR